mmetsp:Transcript_63261/g.120684  ORF Transcript_63261/g.120684 Transcript_63261/m.120684 type:complete len:724 (-) Transcript_63261:155-2326(-)
MLHMAGTNVLLITFPVFAKAAAPLSWDAAYEKADLLLAQMTTHEKYSLMTGIGWYKIPVLDKGPPKKWWFAGNTPPNQRLGIPSLNMQDAANGFRDAWRDNAGRATAWPSLLALAATWDTQIAYTYAAALGDEFREKGANMILGPSVNVHRSSYGGRNYEYLSGEDPYLGAQLTRAYVKGVQSRGVAAVVKHYVFNSQETNRRSESNTVDDKTAWELYFPPFQAAVEAGVSAVMCAYNKIDGVYSCSNRKYLRILKETMGFRGFVQSDWYATHAVSVEQGLDQEMPGPSDYYSPKALARVNASLVDASVRRILAVMYRMRLFNSTKCSGPAEDWLMKNVTSAAHSALARKVASKSIVLLKNEGGILPIANKTIKRIAVVGSPAASRANNPWGPLHWDVPGDYYAGGGSGHVTAGNLVTPLDGIKRRAAAAGIEVIAEASDDRHRVTAAAAQADLTVVVAATTSWEGSDRSTLNLDNNANALVDAVAAQVSKVVVIVQAPGAVLMPWRDSVQAIGLMFLGGQETGSAWASVLFGDRSPTGRLPIMLPASETDTIPPSKSKVIKYSEGMATSYRNRNFSAAFPFGHGLSYSAFAYDRAEKQPCNVREMEAHSRLCISVSVNNTGEVNASTVAQLYLELPANAGHPAALLKGFQQTGLLSPGASVRVTFELSDRDLSYYSAASGVWVLAAGRAFVHIGESSKDIRTSLPIMLGNHATHGSEATVVV